MAPPLVVAFALAGRADWDVHKEPLGRGSDGKPVYLKDIWPTQKEVDEAMKSVSAQMFRETYSEVFKGTAQWQALPVPEGDTYAWDAASTYVQNPPYFEGMKLNPPEITDITRARGCWPCLATALRPTTSPRPAASRPTVRRENT